ncbi:hypothetical protein GCM10007036_40930 [Alsobacter metallidurans]|uniref:PepSY domain-containing protein n=1 Tax=Alsobacter metallidurans TaxID=340221 RepID=A0A917IB05_9HYPH|nr:hypothetical protein [Alsobacter metallidurans]GGH30379.1 hypothetical protein GCM10007036_40930 [Alsobacter metallidurans]
MFAFIAAGVHAGAVRRFARRGALALAALTAATPVLAAPLGSIDAPVGALVERAQWFGFRVAPEEIADILYARYGMQRVMRIRSVGDVYEADAVDRRGFRVHVTLDAQSGRMLESFVVGARAYDAPVPTPPRGVPGGAYRDPYRDLPSFPGDDQLERRNLRSTPDPFGAERTPARPPRNREARTPDAATAPAAPRKPKAVPTPPKPTEQAVPQPAPVPDKPASTAARPAAPEQDAIKPAAPQAVPAPAPTVVPPTTTPPVVAPPKPAAEEPAAPAVRQAAPAPQRIPEPLVDPKTGQPNASVPVAPLDDSSNKGPSTPTPSVPPATLD